jgi:hypothetical protein
LWAKVRNAIAFHLVAFQWLFQLLRVCVQLDIHYWVVTNYNEFIFGSFSHRECRSDRLSQVSYSLLSDDDRLPHGNSQMWWEQPKHIRSNVLLDNVVRQRPWLLRDPIGMHWMVKLPALGSHTFLQIPMELTPIPNPYRREWVVLRESIRSNSKKRRYDDSEEDADFSDPPVIASSSLPVYKTPAPMTKKRKLSAPTVILKENAVAGPSAPRHQSPVTTSFVPNAGRAPTLVQSNLPNPSKLRLMGSALTKQSSFGMASQASSLHPLRKYSPLVTARNEY